jgi:hypothetical protein
VNWDAIGAIGELAGALVVVLTLFYLAAQIRQNTLAVKASSHHGITDSFNNVSQILASDPNVARIYRLGNTGLSALSEDELVSFSFIGIMYMRIFETLYYQYQSGIVEEELYSTEENTLRWVFSNPGFREWWQANPISFSPQYRDYIAQLIQDIENAG